MVMNELVLGLFNFNVAFKNFVLLVASIQTLFYKRSQPSVGNFILKILYTSLS